jgi:endonuclease/exonuclease/phosphatase family metal-dependent hydrolase
MNRILKYSLRAFLMILLCIVLYVVLVLTHGTMTDWQPETMMDLEEGQQQSQLDVVTDSVLSFVIWNIGYGGLGAESDFFMDKHGMFFSGGQTIYPDQSLSDKYREGIRLFAESTQADFFLFQEVDVASNRSYLHNQQALLQAEKPEYASFFAPNYKSSRVPIPILEPWHVYGKVKSGLVSLFKYQPTQSTRIQLPGSFDWPVRIFQLDRCVSVHRFDTENGKELVVMNVHNSAYDKGGVLKKQQMAYLRELFIEEYEKGSYVIVGGDWNQCPPFFKFDGFMPGKAGMYTQINIEPDFLPEDWQWVYDPRVPTNRKNISPYVPGTSFVTLIDFFLISPNVKALQVKCLDQQFRYSDHQPVWMEVELQ